MELGSNFLKDMGSKNVKYEKYYKNHFDMALNFEIAKL